MYESFAEVYDILMDTVPYEEWKEYVVSVLEEHGVLPGDLVLDLGCGTGKMTRLLAKQGYDMIGLDASPEMLDAATSKIVEEEILYLNQDMCCMELFGTVKAVISLCDCVNYILDRRDLCSAFSLVNNYLDPGGIFLFDFNTDYKYRELIGESTIAEDREECSFIWDNYYDEESGINEYDLTLFIREEGDLYRKYVENHMQKGYTLEEMKEVIHLSGLSFLSALDADTLKPVTKESARIYILAKEQGKTDTFKLHK